MAGGISVSAYQMKTPVLLIIFNRPDSTRKVFAAIRQARPPKLFVSADGPRPGNKADLENCRAARAIINQVDWDCELYTNLREENFGCMRGPCSAITWFFDQVEEGIIFEDDCLPHPTFFRFCEELLARYRDDERVMTISGDNFLFGRKEIPYSYYFSRYPHIWGWATWRRAWQHFDATLSLWPTIKKENRLIDLFEDKNLLKTFTRLFDKVYEGEIVTVWDYQWTFTSLMQNGLTILPKVNLVSNIGFLPAGTHTQKENVLANLPSEPMVFPLSHPPFVLRDSLADQITQSYCFNLKWFPLRALSKIKRIIT
jgi:hypothetical protein